MNAKATSSKKSRQKVSAKTAVAEVRDEPAEVDEVEDEAGEPARRSAGRPRVAPNSGDVFGAAELARHVAESLRHHRKIQQLSLDDLAQKSGVSRAALSQIEGARTNPTLAVLWKIAVGLGMPFQQLLGTQSGTGPKILRAGDSSPLRSANGQMESRLLSPGGAPPGLEVYELRLAPRGSHQSEPHSKGTTETLVVLTGALRMTVGDESYELATGDTIFFNADVPHTYESRSSHPTRCLNVISYPRT
ncbi:MAG TPA: XRE family transcriptional regulator [Polyangiaceae bacterium]|nr:XRE family transcriptional regulator [Polyangiaceae bacterium]